jgi:hypothetical protein
VNIKIEVIRQMNVISIGSRLPPLYNEEVQDAPSIVTYYQIYEILPFTPLFYDVKIRFVSDMTKTVWN